MSQLGCGFLPRTFGMLGDLSYSHIGRRNGATPVCPRIRRHHVTQRRNARQVILSSDGDRVAYLELLRQALQKFYGKIIMVPHREKTMVPLPSVPAFVPHVISASPTD